MTNNEHGRAICYPKLENWRVPGVKAGAAAKGNGNYGSKTTRRNKMSNVLFCINCEHCFGQKVKVSMDGATPVLKVPKMIKCHNQSGRWDEASYTSSPEACHMYLKSEK